MKTSELIRLLKQHGCYYWKSGGNHDKWKTPSGDILIIPRHTSKEVKQAGIKI
ncbi:MAG: type II toxin-antitoxin system HicA family toxin [Bacteroidaceae bacterium]|nr:type II toxin-antitoxin system HicA family toxin [Bacteroidaceae bacterium]